MFDPSLETKIQSIEDELRALSTQAEMAVKNGVIACDQAKIEDVKARIAGWTQ